MATTEATVSPQILAISAARDPIKFIARIPHSPIGARPGRPVEPVFLRPRSIAVEPASSEFPRMGDLLSQPQQRLRLAKEPTDS